MNPIDDIIEDFEKLNMGQLRVLIEVDREPGRCIKEIADELQLDYKTCLHYIKFLRRPWRKLKMEGGKLSNDEQNRLVRCRVSKDDKRFYEVFITVAGHELIRKLQQAFGDA